ncbi:MAG: aminotransferase class V-fold PLP-dependent enzyme [Eubacteriales bacterium]|nr:aminotransferase class V-fold PLP-dependent enzyme [Eubacteriales bacterium]
MGEFKRVYLDNAATTMKKPPCVTEAVVAALESFGNSGRDTGSSAMDASRVIYEARCLMARLFHMDNPKQIVFTSNSTEAINLALRGLLKTGDHVISSMMEHNAVLRPIYDLEEEGITHTFIGLDEKGRLLYDEIEKNICDNTRALVFTHASNVTGNANDLYRLGEIAKKHGLLFIVDASQTAGVLPIDMEGMHIDVLAFTGHKGLYGPQGTGGMAVREGLLIKPVKSGGTGVLSYLHHQPDEMPTHLECGTMNGHGLAGLRASVSWLLDEIGVEAVHSHEIKLAKRFYDGIRDIPCLHFYGDYDTDERAAIVSLNIADYDSSEVSDELEASYGISTRPGAHCAPLLHEAMGTVEQGAVRFAFSWFNTEEETDYAIRALRELAEGE